MLSPMVTIDTQTAILFVLTTGVAAVMVLRGLGASMLERKTGRCAVCGGPTRNDGECAACRRL
jgi:hypothetical protein